MGCILKKLTRLSIPLQIKKGKRTKNLKKKQFDNDTSLIYHF